METDPVCGMAVERTEVWRKEYGGRLYFFCSKACLESFNREPERYAGVAVGDAGRDG